MLDPSMAVMHVGPPINRLWFCSDAGEAPPIIDFFITAYCFILLEIQVFLCSRSATVLYVINSMVFIPGTHALYALCLNKVYRIITNIRLCTNIQGCIYVQIWPDSFMCWRIKAEGRSNNNNNKIIHLCMNINA